MTSCTPPEEREELRVYLTPRHCARIRVEECVLPGHAGLLLTWDSAAASSSSVMSTTDSTLAEEEKLSLNPLSLSLMTSLTEALSKKVHGFNEADLQYQLDIS